MKRSDTIKKQHICKNKIISHTLESVHCRILSSQLAILSCILSWFVTDVNMAAREHRNCEWMNWLSYFMLFFAAMPSESEIVLASADAIAMRQRTGNNIFGHTVWFYELLLWPPPPISVHKISCVSLWLKIPCMTSNFHLLYGLKLEIHCRSPRSRNYGIALIRQRVVSHCVTRE